MVERNFAGVADEAEDLENLLVEIPSASWEAFAAVAAAFANTVGVVVAAAVAVGAFAAVAASVEIFD